MVSGQQHGGIQLKGLALSTHRAVWVSPKGLGWYLALMQLQKAGLASSAVPALWQVQGMGG